MKTTESKTFWLAVAILVGTVIGVGIFGIPYVIAQIGVVPAIGFFLLLGGIQLLQNLFMTEAALACPQKLRLIGLTGRFLGRKARRIAAIATVFGTWGSLVAYILIGGQFLFLLLSPLFGGQAIYYQIGWGVVGSVTIFWGLGLVEQINFAATVALCAALLLIVGLAIGKSSPANFQLIAPGNWFMAYGVILFSLSGATAVTEMKDVLVGRHRQLRRAVVVGSIVASVLTAAFAFAVYGVTGAGSTEDAVTGLKAVMGNGITLLMAGFGFLAVATSYFILAINLKSSFEYDYKIHRLPAWFLTCGMPLVLLLIGVNNFIGIISFTGAVFGGITAVIISLLYVAVSRRGLLKEKALRLSVWWAYLSIAILSVGALREIVAVIKTF